MIYLTQPATESEPSKPVENLGQWQVYTHLWQTAAPRLSIRLCQCAECSATYADADGYEALVNDPVLTGNKNK